MAPSKGEVTLGEALDIINGGTIKARTTALDDLVFLLDKRAKVANLSELADKHFHRIFETLFKCVVTEKQAYYSGKKATAKAAAGRLSKSAEALRLAVNHAAPKLKRKTVLALIDHITQVLPESNTDGLVEPLAQDYIKTLIALLSHQPNVEHTSTDLGKGWLDCVEFCLDTISQHVEGVSDRDSGSRGSPAPGTASSTAQTYSLVTSSGRSSANLTQRQVAGRLSRTVLQDLLHCLYLLVVPANAPVASKARDISVALLQVLQLRQLGISQVIQYAFASLNVLLDSIKADALELACTLSRDLVPHITHWWQSRAASKDEMLNVIRDEMLKTIFHIHLHLQHLVADKENHPCLTDIEELADGLWTEYMRRDERAQLRLEDILFLPAENAFSLKTFSLRPHSQDGERKWTFLQSLALLERIILKAPDSSHSAYTASPQDPDEQSRKRRRTAAHSPNRTKQKLSVSQTAAYSLQLIPFLLELEGPDTETISRLDFRAQVISYMGDAQSTTASWAMVASASYLVSSNLFPESFAWSSAWQLASRVVSLPNICRPACHLLHVLLKTDALPYHAISDEVNSIVANADVNGPATLVDSSADFMLHLWFLRNTKSPNASQQTSHHVLRWAFLRWTPTDYKYACLHSPFLHPTLLANIIRVCCGCRMIPRRSFRSLVGGAIYQAWNACEEKFPLLRYLLLLPEVDELANDPRDAEHPAEATTLVRSSDEASVHASKKLALELLSSKVESLREVATSWNKKGVADVGVHISPERLGASLSACITACILAPDLQELNSRQSREIEPAIFEILDACLEATQADDRTFFDILMRTICLHIPRMTVDCMASLANDQPLLMVLLARVSAHLQDRTQHGSTGPSQSFDNDDDFESQETGASSASKSAAIPRHRSSLRYHGSSGDAFLMATQLRLIVVELMSRDRDNMGTIPPQVVDHISEMSSEEFLLGSEAICEIIGSGDFSIDPADALRIIEKIGSIFVNFDFTCCEVAQITALEIIEGLGSVWLESQHDILGHVGDLYHYIVKTSHPKNCLSPRSQIALARLLFYLLANKPSFGDSSKLPSFRTTLLFIMERGPLFVKHYIAKRLPDVFGLYVLKTHDDVFVDVLANLPADPGDIEGIAFRLFVLAELACRWPTLLRRCTYHIFETPAKITGSTPYARRCFDTVSNALKLESPQELFRIFCSQLLYTWLEEDVLEQMPYTVFGFDSLEDMVRASQAEAAALLLMRNQEGALNSVAKQLGIQPADMVKQGFAKIMAYTIAHDTSTAATGTSTAESRVRRSLGKDAFMDSIYASFADIVAQLFDVFDQEDLIEKYLAKDVNFAYAATAMEEMKKHSHSSVILPANQQPMFRAKYLLRELFNLCGNTQYELQNLWTPALVVFVARSLFNTVHPALGPLHACSALRKVRVLICLSGQAALEAYPLEMLLHSIRPFIGDSECADDALGMTQYLISKGKDHITQAPSFFAGYALSTLASLRVFLESTQSSTTQESQFKATKSKAQQFHDWFSNFASNYDSPVFANEQQRSSFKTITQAAAKIGSSGNADSGTHESTLLLEILTDDNREERLLDKASQDLAMGLLCGDFVAPTTSRQDVIDDDVKAIEYAGTVWNSCKADALSDEYLAWAGRVIGRSFAASGEPSLALLRESRLRQYEAMTNGHYASKQGILTLLQRLTFHGKSHTAGLAEASLRAILSDATAQEDSSLLAAAEKTLTEAVYVASVWQPYRTPPSDNGVDDRVQPSEHAFAQGQIKQDDWAQDLVTYLTQSVSDTIILTNLFNLIGNVKDFALDALPFIVHLALQGEVDRHQVVKRQLSDAMKQWLLVDDDTAQSNQKLIINTMLYLRTQEYPNENSIADRSQWLEVDLNVAAAASSRCGMQKSALLFTELAASQTTRSSRRSSAMREVNDSTQLLLNIYENIDDPDAYYGLPQPADLSTVVARLEYEQDGGGVLAFRGAQYDSRIQRKDAKFRTDGISLVKALGSIGLSGLSHSLLQAQKGEVENDDSLSSTFQTARRLALWNLPVPNSSHNQAVTLYNAFQTVHLAVDTDMIRKATHDAFSHSMRMLATNSLNASSLRQHLGALAALTELDDVANVADFADLKVLVGQFERRASWMRRGRYNDVSQLLSCRDTTFGMLSQHSLMRTTANISSAQAREMEIRNKLLSSRLYRFHQATQESLNLAVSLTDLVNPSAELGLNVDAAIKIEAANSLWDRGEMSSSIRMLQALDESSMLKKQTIPVSRSDLLSRTAHQVSVAKLETPHDIQKQYLEPALKELKGKSEGNDAGKVYHQFAMFCDEQLQSQDGQEDLARLQNLRQGKSEEVTQLRNLIASTRDSQVKNRYSSFLAKAQQWLHLDEQELRRVEQTRREFVRLSLENYLLSLTASDEFNNDALRFTALWLEKSGDLEMNESVQKHLDKVPSRKFAALMNQLSSRLQDQATPFQKLLIQLIFNICVEHPYHGMYQIWSGVRTKTNSKDEVAVLRQKATERVSKQLEKDPQIGVIWHAIDRTSGYYHRLAVDRDNAKYKAGHKIALKDVTAGSYLVNALNKYRVPPPTMQLELAADGDYSNVPIISKLEPMMSIASGVSAPKIITAIGSDGKRYRQLVKGGNDDLRQDAIMEQVFAAVSSLLKLHRETQQRNLDIRTYKVLPLTSVSGLIEFVPNTIPLHEFLMPAHERYYPKDLKGGQCRKEISNAQGKSVEVRMSTFRKVKDRFHPVMRYFFMEYFVDPDDWFAKRTAYTRSTAAISVLGHILGLGDRHGHNILLDHKTGEAVHIDLGVAFEMGRVLPVPELVPFRMTRDIEDGMGITKTEGVFRRCCEFTLDALREETYSIMTILDVLRYDPLYSWSISPVRLAKLQDAREAVEQEVEGKRVNEPSEADRALEVVRKKLSKTLSVTATVNELINQATDERNLAVLYSGWAAYA